MSDQYLPCQWKTEGNVCGDEFVFTERDQNFFADKGYSTPKYCKPHREERKRQHEAREAKRTQPEERVSDREILA